MMSKRVFAEKIRKNLVELFGTESPSRLKWRFYKASLQRKFRKQRNKNRVGMSPHHMPIKPKRIVRY